ncbi:FAD-binding oxidoreductase [Micromonospora sp. DR5-3]|uniref:FAD-binding oxidoreductase n=1 Tax=unclassified Micromonospora TaxID=2617518 RepID=UPI0011D31554|nr:MULTISPECIES: FAD-binding oxidoreductase [unclassified Micromonospora]MCW3815844.1 FAD-binding oxidoreductase [Micromonospora sp. DR5-3]TYC24361.1 oxidoreductase [Micromonospora sp. MP36]
MTEPEAREAVARWLSLVAADAELSPYLIAVDWDRLKAHLARSLTSATGGEREVPRLGWSEAQHRRAVDYLLGVLERHHERSVARFWEAVEDRCPGLLPEREAPLLHAALHQLASGAGDRPNRLALLAVLGRAYRRYGLRPAHAAVIDGALPAAVPWQKVERAAARMGDGLAWWPAEVIGHDRACDGVAILTVRPWRRLPFRPGQAVPVCTPRRPGQWRWLCPANAPRPDGTVELHVRAVPGGAVSTSLVHEVRPGELLHLGPPVDTGLSLVDGDLLLVAGGTGLAPLRALVEQVAADPGGRRVTLVVGARSVESLYDAVTLDKLRHDWLTIVPAFSHDPLAEPGERGDALTVALDHLRPDQAVYVCGPPAMLAGSRLRLLAAGVPGERIHLPERIPWR